VVCYMNAGGWEEWRPDAGEFPTGIIGDDLNDWEVERWLDVRRVDILASIMEARMDSCRDEGFDGIEPDNIDGFLNDTGYDLTSKDQLAYIWLAGADRVVVSDRWLSLDETGQGLHRTNLGPPRHVLDMVFFGSHPSRIVMDPGESWFSITRMSWYPENALVSGSISLRTFLNSSNLSNFIYSPRVTVTAITSS